VLASKNRKQKRKMDFVRMILTVLLPEPNLLID
jgi:hypothetical protein